MTWTRLDGTRMVAVRVPDCLLARCAEAAAAEGMTRADWVADALGRAAAASLAVAAATEADQAPDWLGDLFSEARRQHARAQTAKREARRAAR